MAEAGEGLPATGVKPKGKLKESWGSEQREQSRRSQWDADWPKGQESPQFGGRPAQYPWLLLTQTPPSCPYPMQAMAL